LNLLQLAAGGPAKPSATSTEIVRREFANASLARELLDDMPGELLSYSFTPNSTSAAHTTEKTAGCHTGGRCPIMQ
jgi:hypothetical protein